MATTYPRISVQPVPTRLGLVLRGLVWVGIVLAVLEPTRSIDFSQTCSKAIVYAMIGISLNILIGYTGQLSLGHQGFIGVGGVVAANLVSKAHWPFAAGLAGSVVAGAAVALILGAVALRITGLYLSLITLVFGFTIASSLLTLPSLTNNNAGLNANRPSWLSAPQSAKFSGNAKFYLFALAVLALVILVDMRITRSKIGRALLALKENERAAEAFGINVTLYKLIAFALCGAIAGLAGGVFVFQVQAFSSQNFEGLIGINLALLFVVMVVVGGPGNRTGVVLASIFFGLIDKILGGVFNHAHGVFGHIPLLSGYYQADSKASVASLIGALLLLQTVIFNPGGLGQVVKPLQRWLGGKPFSLHDPDEASGPSAVEGSSVRA